MKFKSEYHQKHYNAWMLQSKHPEWGKCKSENPLFKESRCYACDEAFYASKICYEDSNHMCKCCPIDWGAQFCTTHGSVYEDWKNEKDPEKSSALCVVIANMEWMIKNE